MPISTRSLERRYQALDRRKSLATGGTFWRRFAHGRSNGKNVPGARRNKSSISEQKAQKPSISSSQDVKSKTIPNASTAAKHGAASSFTNKHLIDRLPSIPHISRPSKEELLAAATGFWSRLKVRFKWFSIRSVRPFNADEIGAFFSWILVGHVLWIILGTTTFFSLAIFAVNTVFAQETLARWVGNYLTKSSGVKVVFESAIVPKWGDGVITFKNVFVSRRPGQGTGRVSKGSAQTAAAAAAATATAEQSREGGASGVIQEEEDTNYTQFDVSLETVNVTLSFTKWFNSKGLLKDVEIKGVRGVIDRTSVHYPGYYIDPRSYKHEHNPGDFEIESFKMEDLLVTVHQPRGFRPFSVSIFSCDLPRLRKQWLFYDFLSANMMSGSFDDSLFTIHPRQMHGLTGSQLLHENDANGAPSPWKKHSRLRIDGLNIDHLNRGVEGPFSWIHQGNVDIVADIMFPVDNDESIAKVMSDFYDRMEATVTSRSQNHAGEGTDIINNDNVNQLSGNDDPTTPVTKVEGKRFVVMDLRLHLNDIRAAVPIFTRDISYVSNALIRPIVAYMNSRNTFIPINCRVVKRVDEFDGSWTIFDSGLMDDLSAETYSAFAKDVMDDQARLRRFKKVGLWSVQLAVQALFMGLAGNIA
ncbi:Mitochondrial distribution and morphology protein 31, mitochondrial precursor [Trapelia coarctata]|nr:Mitochondrial distribution and morphology protein 31, mitochondrial precursor [Trapelia coarctata]